MNKAGVSAVSNWNSTTARAAGSTSPGVKAGVRRWEGMSRVVMLLTIRRTLSRYHEVVW